MLVFGPNQWPWQFSPPKFRSEKCVFSPNNFCPGQDISLFDLDHWSVESKVSLDPDPSVEKNRQIINKKTGSGSDYQWRKKWIRPNKMHPELFSLSMKVNIIDILKTLIVFRCILDQFNPDLDQVFFNIRTQILNPGRIKTTLPVRDKVWVWYI